MGDVYRVLPRCYESLGPKPADDIGCFRTTHLDQFADLRPPPYGPPLVEFRELLEDARANLQLMLAEAGVDLL